MPRCLNASVKLCFLFLIVLAIWETVFKNSHASFTPPKPATARRFGIKMMEQNRKQKQPKKTMPGTTMDNNTREEDVPSNSSIVADRILGSRNETSGNMMNRNVNTDGRLYAWAPGRLGNKLYNLASTYGLARTNHRRLVLPPEIMNPIQRFLNASYLDFEKGPPPSGCITKSGLSGKYVEEMEHLPPQVKDIRIGPYVEIFKYFQAYAIEIRKFMVVRDDLVRGVGKFLRSLPHVSVNSTLVGIHIRRGDRRFKEGQVLPKANYLRRAMTYYLQKYRHVHFVVCSEDYVWCERNETFLQPRALKHVSRGDYWVHYSNKSATAEWDLALLSQCNHNIMTVGTFGWWGAWIAGGEAIYFKHPVKEGSQLAKRFSVDDTMWPMWIAMGDEEDQAQD